MTSTSILEQEIQRLILTGDVVSALFLKSANKIGDQRRRTCAALSREYQPWYSESRRVVATLMPERLEEFDQLYRHERKNYFNFKGYTISDYLQLVGEDDVLGMAFFNKYDAAYEKFRQQLMILHSANMMAKSRISSITQLVQSKILDNELDGAKQLLKAGYIRPAGVLGGVVLEHHLKSFCENKGLSLGRKKPTLSNLNTTIKNSQLIDIPTFRRIQLVTDIRNLCAHTGDREPDTEDVEQMLIDVERLTRTVY